MSNSTSFDSGRSQVGAVYAKALLAAATAAGKADDVVTELESFVSDVLSKLPSFAAALASLRVSGEQKVKLLTSSLQGRMSPLLLNALKVMAEHGRLDSLRETAQAARKLLNESKGRIEVTLRTAAPIAPAVQQQVAARLKTMLGKDVDLKTEVQPDILGGLIVRVGDTLYDGSVANRLANMRTEAVNDTLAALRAAPERFAQA
jgi:F-type H+-transporting ATPase subunit delta